jgi:acetyl-CoA synthetase
VLSHEKGTDRTALIQQEPSGGVTRWTYAELDRWAGELASGLHARGVEQGDRVAVVASQRVETPLIHVAVYRLGAVAVPLSVLYGPDALEFRFADSETDIVFASADAMDAVRTAVERIDTVDRVVGIDADPPAVEDVVTERFTDVSGNTNGKVVDTAPNDPAVLL